eukprot:gene2687-10795_t
MEGLGAANAWMRGCVDAWMRGCVAEQELITAQKAAKEKAPEQWTDMELSVLHKAASKVFPPGTINNRWGQIADYLQVHAHTTWRRKDKEVILQVKSGKDITASLAKKKAAGAMKGL